MDRFGRRSFAAYFFQEMFLCLWVFEMAPRLGVPTFIGRDGVKIFPIKNYCGEYLNNIFALQINVTWFPFPTYLLIFPEKNHGILAGRYLRRRIRVEANNYHKEFFKASSQDEAFSFKPFQFCLVFNATCSWEYRK